MIGDAQVAIFAILTAVVAVRSPPTWMGKFNARGAPPAPWRMVPLKRERPTEYRVTTVAGRSALEARVKGSMSLMARPIRVDLKETPVLCWRWYVDAPVARADMTRKSGDDYAARVYIAFDMPDEVLSGSTRLKLKIASSMFGQALPDAAVVYVWDNRNPIGTARKSSFTDRSQLIVPESGAGRAGTWVSKRVDLQADFAKAFGNKPGKPIQLAVAADGDNTKSNGRAAFADIHFVARDAPCAF